MSPAIKVVTGLVLAMTAGFLLASVVAGAFLAGGLLLGGVVVMCYLFAPTAYEISDQRLTVRRRLGERVFGPVVGCGTVAERLPWGLRLWGNGGLFACTGIFWNKTFGVFRAYLTSSRYQDLVLVKTRNQTILISPQDPGEFVRACESGQQVAAGDG